MKITTHSNKPGQPKIRHEIYVNNEIHIIGTQHRLYNLRYKMIQRCYNSKPSEFNAYQGKGITVCEEWRNNPDSFFEFCLSNGWKQGLQLDRIDSNANYEPSNVRIVSASENSKSSWIGRVGEKTGKNKIDTNTAISIKLMLSNSERVCDIARKLSITQDIVKDIKRGKTWKHI